MPYIGNTVQTQGFTPAIDYFNGNGVTVTFTLSRPIASVAQVIVAVDNVIQNPSSAFNVVGNSITFTSAPLSGTNNIWVEYTSLITTYQGISQDPTVIGDIRATGGYLAEGDFGNSFVDGAILDYVTGAGRVTVGELDDLIFYHGGTAGRSEMMKVSYAGNSTLEGKLTATGNGSFQGVYIGRGGGNVATNTVLGASALNANTTGGNLTAVGYQAGYSNTTGGNFSAFGGQAGYTYNSTTENWGSVFVGFRSGQFTTTGNDNAFVGGFAGRFNTTGSYNVALGAASLYSNTTASNNTAVGYQALYNSNRTADTVGRNVAVGGQALFSLTTGNETVGVGHLAGYSCTTSGANIFIGQETGYATTGNLNCFVGYAAGSLVTTGSKNTILGKFNGNQGGLDIRTLDNRIVLSDGDGNPRYVFANGSNHFGGASPAGFGGNGLIVPTYNGSNQPAIRSYDTDSSSNTNNVWAIVRNSTQVGTITTSLSNTSYNTSSDYRLKYNIAPMTGALATVALLKPCTYTWKSTGETSQGFIAHELQAVVPDAVTGEKDAVDAEGKPVYQGIDTSFLVATLTAAIQEQQQIITDLKARIEALEAK